MRQQLENRTPAAKAALQIQPVTARLKPCPQAKRCISTSSWMELSAGAKCGDSSPSREYGWAVHDWDVAVYGDCVGVFDGGEVAGRAHLEASIGGSFSGRSPG